VYARKQGTMKVKTIDLAGQHTMKSKQVMVPFDLQDSQMACSQQGRRKALTASLLQIAQRSLIGISS
jgi:hypothetical protein